jgi:hypothetical protein
MLTLQPTSKYLHHPGTGFSFISDHLESLIPPLPLPPPPPQSPGFWVINQGKGGILNQGKH